MTLKIHRQCVKAAGTVSLPLKAALVEVGRVTLPDRSRIPLPAFLARAITGQQLSVSAARSIWARVEIAVKANGSTIPDFFTARNRRVLRQCGLSNAKVQAVIAIREAHEAGLLSVRKLRRMNHAERSAHLQQIWGVGQWTADMTSIFYFRDPDVWPQGDIGVYRALCRLTGKRSTAALAKLAGSFAPYRSFLAMYMWRVLDQPKEAARRSARGPKQPV
jgi:DNA-3-methyladenine glycosylase II